MSKHEWKPGDVGVATTGERFIVTREHRCAWVTLRGDVVSGEPSPDDRPLVVIDPAGDEVTDLAAALAKATARSGFPWEGSVRERAGVLRGVLREFANPPPPKPEEPTGCYAEVEDDGGHVWFRDPVGSWRRTDAPGHYVCHMWESVPAVRVLSEGVAE